MRFALALIFLCLSALVAAPPCPEMGALSDVPRPFSFEALEQRMAAKGITPEQLVAAIRQENFLGSGLNSQVFSIPGVPDFVLRVDHELARAILAGKPPEGLARPLERGDDFAPHLNFGQTIGYVGRIEILKRQGGKPAGLSRRFGDQVPEAARYRAEYKQRMREAAEMPQEAYDTLAEEYKYLLSVGWSHDNSKSDNLLIDTEAKRLNIVDVLNPFQIPPDKRELFRRAVLDQGEDFWNRFDFGDYVHVLIGDPMDSALPGDVEANAYRRAIIEKLARAAKRKHFGFGNEGDLTPHFKRAGIEVPPALYFQRLTP